MEKKGAVRHTCRLDRALVEHLLLDRFLSEFLLNGLRLLLHGGDQRLNLVRELAAEDGVVGPVGRLRVGPLAVALAYNVRRSKQTKQQRKEERTLVSCLVVGRGRVGRLTLRECRRGGLGRRLGHRLAAQIAA
jgi:hypothetical protein